ncbi:neurexin [Paragonimus westermani]|uniref:Neurexin n=1 Tax=Paragonimus westermani TaxID=34504 RepID=A0A5J4NVW7_9TREM|nr:neurexin [Paragonimus westermani]
MQSDFAVHSSEQEKPSGSADNTQAKPSQRQIHANQAELKLRRVLISLDEQMSITQSLPYYATQLTIQEIYVGKKPSVLATLNLGTSLNVPRQQFRGCLREMICKSGGVNVYLLDSQKANSIGIALSKDGMRKECDTGLLKPRTHLHSAQFVASSPHFITFAKSGGYLRTTGWRIVASAELSFKIRTTEPNGLLLYGSSVNEFDLYDRLDSSMHTLSIPGAGKSGFDIMALELRDGCLVSIINTGSGAVQLGTDAHVRGNQSKLNLIADGKTHLVDVKFQEGSLYITVDGASYISHTADEKTYKYLNLNGLFYLGGMPDSMRQISWAISPEVWSVRLNHDYTGCLGDFTVNNQPWDLDLELRACWAEGRLHQNCFPPSLVSDWCENQGCKNGGLCSLGWNGHICDCTNTNFMGDWCGEEPLVFSFNGHQWIDVQFGPFPVQSLVEDLIIRFRTRQPNGLLFTTNSPSSAATDCLEVRIDSGYLLVIYDFGEDSKKYKSFVFIADDNWHTVRIQRRERFLNFTVDHSSQLYDIPKDGRFLSHKRIILGRSRTLSDRNPIEQFPRRAFNQFTAMSMRYSVFIGHVMKFLFNGVDFLHVAKHVFNRNEYSYWKDRLEITATEGLHQPLLEFPLSFALQDSYVGIDIPNSWIDFTLEFWIKANKNFGAFLLLSQGFTDLFGLEIMNGRLQLVYTEPTGTHKVQSAQTKAIVDSKWHRVQLIRRSTGQPSLVIKLDDEAIVATVPIPDYLGEQHVYIGGIPSLSEGVQPYATVRHRHQPRLFHSTSGFAGCVASITVNRSLVRGDAYDADSSRNSRDLRVPKSITLFSGEQRATKWNKVEPGCRVYPTGPTMHLSAQLMSSATFELSPTQNTTRDQLAFGIQAVKSGAINLLSIKGQGDSADFLEVSIVLLKARYVILVRYSMGGGQHTVYETNVDICDGRYHIVQFVRDGANSMLRIDLEHERTNIPKGQQGTHFNALKQIHLGVGLKDRLDKKDYLNSRSQLQQDMGFVGFISSINFNGIDLFKVFKGLVIPGIFLSDKHNVYIQKHFKPKLDHLDKANRGSDTTSHLTANDMQLQPSGVNEYRTEPLVVPKIECIEQGNVHDSKTCRPIDEDGIIIPYVEFEKASTSNGKTKKVKNKKEWNADQSRQKQPQPNDSGSTSSHKNSAPNSEVANWLGKKINHIDQNWPERSSATGTDQTNYPFYIHDKTKGIRVSSEPLDFGGSVNLGVDQKRRFVFNIGLIASVSVAGICVLIVISCVIYRCMRRDEGSYNVGESLAYTEEPVPRVRTMIEEKHSSKDPDSTGMLLLKSPKKISTEGKDGCISLSENSPTVYVTFSDVCTTSPTNTGAHIHLVTSKNEAPISPSTSSIENEKRRSQLIKVDSPMDRKLINPTKMKLTKTGNESQEWRLPYNPEGQQHGFYHTFPSAMEQMVY